MIKAIDALQKLIDGNRRYIENKQIYPNQNQETRDALLVKQTPYAIILSCSDSRVPPELIFDAGLGELFVIRVGGHTLSSEVAGSIEYAVETLGTKLVMILGHDNCGAVKTAIQAYKNKAQKKLSPSLQAIMSHIYPAVKKTNRNHSEESCLGVSIKCNVEQQAKKLLANNKHIAKKVKSGDIMLITANYSLKTGAVEIYNK